MQKIKNIFNQGIIFFKSIYLNLFEQTSAEKKDKKFLFLYFVTIIALLFFLSFFLMKKNPLQLLIPFSLFDLPKIDSRKETTLFVLDGKGSILKTKRKILLNDLDLSKNIDILISELSKPPYEDKVESEDETVFPKKTLNLKNALIVKWLLEDNSKIVLDFKEANLNKELSTIRTKSVLDEEDSIFEKRTKEEEENFKKSLEEIQKQKLKSLDISFQCLEKTIFENFKEIKSIEYRLDGKIKSFPNLEYNLTLSKKRE